VLRGADYTTPGGLTVTLGAAHNVAAVHDRDFNNLVVACHSLDGAIDPPPRDPPLDFTISEDMLRRRDDH
jgi:hypothetical protein